MQSHNVTVSPVLLDAIRQLVERENLPSQKLAQAVADLSRVFTKERGQLNRTYLDDRLLGIAYLHYFLPVNLAKIQILLDEMPVPELAEGFSVLDLGSGPGTATLAVLDWWHQRRQPSPLSVTAVDSAKVALGQARQLWDRYSQTAGVENVDLQTFEGDLRRRTRLEQAKQRGPFDLIILANCLNEIHIDGTNPIEARTDFVAECVSLLAPHGTMMIMEPALRETSRALHQVRDCLLKEKRCTVYSPCLHENGCPALANPTDWCHEERSWNPPAMIEEIDEAVGFIKDALKFSYLLLRKDGKTIIERRPDVYRVVSELRVMKGEKRAWLCNEQGRQEVGRQDRLQSETNKALGDWHRGAIARISEIVRKERKGRKSTVGRIQSDASTEVIRPVL